MPLPRSVHLALFFCVLFGLASPLSAQTQRPPVTVDVATPRQQSMPRTLDLIGSLHSSHDIEIASQVAGKVEAIAFTEGQPVAAGDLLIELDEDVYRAEVNQARASLELAQLRYDRSTRLLKQQAISQSAVDESRAELAERRASLELAEVRLAKTRIKAPFSGVVGISNVSVGDYVTPGQPLVSLVDYNTLQVDFKAPASALQALAMDKEVAFSVDSLGGSVFSATVTAMQPRVDASSRSLWVRAAVDSEADLLRPGMFVRLQVVLGANAPRLTIPEQALMASRTGYRVFVVEDGLAYLRSVEVGLRRNGHVVIEAGLDPGHTVVTTGQLKLYDGARVEVRNKTSLITESQREAAAVPAEQFATALSGAAP